MEKIGVYFQIAEEAGEGIGGCYISAEYNVQNDLHDTKLIEERAEEFAKELSKKLGLDSAHLIRITKEEFDTNSYQGEDSDE